MEDQRPREEEVISKRGRNSSDDGDERCNRMPDHEEEDEELEGEGLWELTRGEAGVAGKTRRRDDEVGREGRMMGEGG